MKKFLSSVLVIVLSGLAGFYGVGFVLHVISWFQLSFAMPTIP